MGYTKFSSYEFMLAVRVGIRKIEMSLTRQECNMNISDNILNFVF